VKLNFIEKLIGSGFYSGYIPLASGTFGSMAALVIYYIPGFEKPFVIIPAILIFTFYGIFIGTKFENNYGKDPAECTVDEIVGMWISLLFVPKVWWISIIVFFLWRIADIIKPYPARKLEKLHGGIGIMIDDIVASIYVLFIVHLFILIL
jgi:phosphatidylglycerophosphatase A